MKVCFAILPVASIALLGMIDVKDENGNKIEPSSQVNNTLQNRAYQKGTMLTPQDQSQSKEDLEITRQIRRGLIKDSSLSIDAKNIKVITINGTITLEGVVDNEDEISKIESIASSFSQNGKVNNLLNAKQ